MITHMFPPFSGVGVIRIAKFARYLPHFGWRPIILTCKRPEKIQDATDQSLLKEIGTNVVIYRTACPSLYSIYRFFGGRVKQGSFGLSENPIGNFVNQMFIPDPYVGWYFTGRLKAQNIFKAHPIDLIFTTSPRETPHLIGLSLKKRYNKPWIADFRDPWLEKAQRPNRSKLLDYIERYMQKSVLNYSDRILTAWPGIGREFKKTSASFSDKVEVLYNGFDNDDFCDISPVHFDTFTLLYAGSLHKALNPEPIFSGLHRLYEKHPDLRQKIQVVLLGRQDAYVHKVVKNYGLQSEVKTISQVAHRDSLSFVIGANVLFFCVPDTSWVPSKIFEYMRSNKPILAVSDSQSEAVRIINSIRPVGCKASRCPETLYRYILQIYQSSRSHGEEQTMNREDLALYDRKSLTADLARYFDEEISKAC